MDSQTVSQDKKTETCISCETGKIWHQNSMILLISVNESIICFVSVV